jgi:hypothetical protein
MAKPNFKDILLAKGEKIGLIAGGAIAALFAVLGVMSIASAESPTSKVKEFESQASRIDNGVRAAGEPAPPLPEWVTKTNNPKPIPPEKFALAGPPFEPLYTPDPRRQNPKVLPVIAYQIDLLRAPMRAIDLIEREDGVLLGAKVDKPVPTKDKDAIQQMTKGVVGSLLNPKAKPKTPPRQQTPPQGQPPMGVPPGAAPPGAGPPGPGQPPGPGGGGGGRGENPYGAFMPGGGQPAGPRDDKAVAYLTPREVQEKGLPLAETVYPARMLLVHALFPLKQQLEEIKEALRLDSIQQAMAESGPGGQPGPVFDGFEVQRRVTDPNGQKSDWALFDHEYEYASKLKIRMWAAQPDTGFVSLFLMMVL